MTHTPSPWKIDIIDIIDTNGTRICFFVDDYCDCWNEANARLIAAAPLMYEALVLAKSIIFELEEMRKIGQKKSDFTLPNGSMVSNVKPLCLKGVFLIDEAIAQAEGK